MAPTCKTRQPEAIRQKGEQMRLFFQDPTGQRLAIDTRRKEWAANYANSETELTDGHEYINVSGPEDLYKLERESDFNSYDYNSNIESGRAPNISLYTDLLGALASYSAAIDAGQADDLADELDSMADRIEKAKAAGYFNPQQYAILILIVDDLKSAADLYDQQPQI